MSKITGTEELTQIPSKVVKMYEAVMRLLEEGADANSIRVSMITERAGIGKGTAYEYFDTKEEIVACAIVYQMQCIFENLENTFSTTNCFEEQLNYFLDELGNKNGGKYCFLKFVHMLTDTSELSRMVREKMEAESAASYRPENVFGRILQSAVDSRELRDDLPLDYMIYCLFSHLVTYMMMIATKEHSQLNLETMKALVHKGVMSELRKQ